MPTVEELQEMFGIDGAVRIEAGRGSLPKIAVATDLASAEIYLYGAHLTHFQPAERPRCCFSAARVSLTAQADPWRNSAGLSVVWSAE